MSNGSSGTTDIYAAVQAWAAVIAIVAGFVYLGIQRWLESRAAAVAAGRLARHSIDFVTERLEALTDPNQPIEFALRGARANEMLEVLRELDVSKLPAGRVESFAIIRSAVHAVNSRINEVLNSDTERRRERRTRLYSAGRTLSGARREYENLIRNFAPWNRKAALPLSSKMKLFLEEADQSSKIS